MNKKRITVIVVIILCIGLIGSLWNASTYALFSTDKYANNYNSYTTGMLSVDAKSKSEKISLTNTLPITDEEGKSSIPYIFSITNTGNLDYQFDVKLLSTGDSATTFSPQYIKVQINDGEVNTLADLTNSIVESDVVLLAGESVDISVRMWLSIDTPNSEIGKSFESRIVVDGYAIHTDSKGLLVEYITNLYLDNKDETPVINNEIEYTYSSSVGLMNDRLGGTTSDYDAGNIRYYGATPNNYIDIGDRDSDGNVILYRIIGVFKDIELEDGSTDNLIKVIRDEDIGTYAFDNKNNGIGTSLHASGSNHWSDARLMMLLNPGYSQYSEKSPLTDKDGDVLYGYEGSLYWTSSSGNCYKGYSNAVTPCDFTGNGLSNDVHSKIATVVWNLGMRQIGYDSYADTYYSFDRGSLTYGDNSAEWTGKVALMYMSDYAYATDFNHCSLASYNNSANSYGCRSHDWLYENEIIQRTLSYTPYEKDGTIIYAYTLGIYTDGGFYNFGVSTNESLQVAIRPSFYLNSDLVFVKGNGSETNPYVVR